MPRKPRFFLPGVPIHIVQRGHSREPVFFEVGDYQAYPPPCGFAPSLALILRAHAVRPDLLQADWSNQGTATIFFLIDWVWGPGKLLINKSNMARLNAIPAQSKLL